MASVEFSHLSISHIRENSRAVRRNEILLGRCQTRNKVEQLCRSTLSRNKFAQVTVNRDGFYPAN